MKRCGIITLCAFTISAVAALAAAHTVLPIDPPTTPPCAADGTCYPNRDFWGHYPGRWRQWPGVELVPTPAGKAPTPAGQFGGELNVNEIPSPEKEDVQAPPSSTKKKPEASTESKTGEGGGEKGGTSGSESPNLPGLPPLPTSPKYETPHTVSPKDSTGDADPPPPLPFPMSSYGGPSNGLRKTAAPVGPRMSSPRDTAAEGDPPPALPVAYRSAAL